jgi:hypothetical protein
MILVLTVYSFVFLWAAGLPDWIVAYATGVTQFGVWTTLLALVPFTAFWISLKRQPYTEISSSLTRPNWAIQIKSIF